MTTTETKEAWCAKCDRQFTVYADLTTLCYWCEALARAANRGWKYVDDRSCPRLLVGKRCLDHSRRGSYGTCWHHNHLNDHAHRWKDSEGNKFVLWEPYQANMEDMTEVLTRAREDGLDVMTSSWGIWTRNIVGLMFTAKEVAAATEAIAQ